MASSSSSSPIPSGFSLFSSIPVPDLNIPVFVDGFRKIGDLFSKAVTSTESERTDLKFEDFYSRDEFDRVMASNIHEQHLIPTYYAGPTHYTPDYFNEFKLRFAHVFQRIKQLPYYEYYKEVMKFETDDDAYQHLLKNCEEGTCKGTTYELLHRAADDPHKPTSELLNCLDYQETIFKQAINEMLIDFNKAQLSSRTSMQSESQREFSIPIIPSQPLSTEDLLKLIKSAAESDPTAMKDHPTNRAIDQIKDELRISRMLPREDFPVDADLSRYSQEMEDLHSRIGPTFSCHVGFDSSCSASDACGHAIFIRLSPDDYSMYDINHGWYQYPSEHDLLMGIQSRALEYRSSLGLTQVTFSAYRPDRIDLLTP